MSIQPGRVVLLGSGETAPTIRKVYDWLFKQLEPSPNISILETPAGFEPNSQRVAERIGEFLLHRLQNYNPNVSIIPARKRGTDYSPNNPKIITPMLQADVMFMGPGSPTYAVRQLQDTLAWHTLVARQLLGTSLILASATTLAFSSHTLPVYEIYKVGDDLHWHLGLDFFGLYGLSLVLIPHWNNTEGGVELDTSRCYMGQARFEKLMAMLPPKQTVVGIDEHTALVLDPLSGECIVLGNGQVTVINNEHLVSFPSNERFSISELGSFSIPSPETVVPPNVWSRVQMVAEKNDIPVSPPPAVLALVEERSQARERRDWATADRLREKIATAGWRIKDTAAGPELEQTEKTFDYQGSGIQIPGELT